MEVFEVGLIQSSYHGTSSKLLDATGRNAKLVWVEPLTDTRRRLTRQKEKKKRKKNFPWVPVCGGFQCGMVASWYGVT